MGKCASFLELGEACTHDYECGRSAMCFFGSAYKMKGYCREYMKIDNDDEGNVVFQNYYGYLDKSEKNHLLCKSLYADANGICRGGGFSTNKG